MSIHITEGEVAPTVLMPGDPMRTKFIAENFLKNVVCYNKIRGMYGYTGEFESIKVSVQGSGMGMPSFSIYCNELIDYFGVKNIIRVGSAGSLQKSVKIRDIILAMGASTTSSMINRRFNGDVFAPTANFELLNSAWKISKQMNLKNVKVGNCISTDEFYEEDPKDWKRFAKYGIDCVEMEAAALYTLAARKRIKALAILTVSDCLVTKEATSAQEREQTFKEMMRLALEVTKAQGQS